MNSEYGQRLSLQELKQRNTQQAVLPTPTPPHEASPTKADWERMMKDLDTEIYNHLTMWDELSFDDKRQTVDQLIRVIYATSDSIKIEWRI